MSSSELVVKVYFCTRRHLHEHGEATAAQMNEVARARSASPLVKDVVFVSKEDALAQDAEEAPGRITRLLPHNPLPDASRVIPKRGDDVAEVAAGLTATAAAASRRSTTARRRRSGSCGSPT